MTKRCTKCNDSKPVEAFCRNRAKVDGLSVWCRACASAAKKRHYADTAADQRTRAKQYREDNQESIRAAAKQRYTRDHAASRDRARNQKYGLTGAQYAEMVKAQAGLCAICKEPPTEQGLCVDHHHETGMIRALLCTRCNAAIGMLLDEPGRARAAAEYLDNYRINVADGGTLAVAAA